MTCFLLEGGPTLLESTSTKFPTRISHSIAFHSNSVLNLNGTRNLGVYVMNPDGTDQIRLTFDPRTDQQPGISPDGRQIVFTWSTLIGDVTDVFATSTSEAARSQDSFDRRADRARSGYDRPHRLTGNFVYELPFYQHQTGSRGKFFGGWQLNSFFTFQSGAPFTVTLGSDPTGSGNPIRPNLNTNLDLSSMTITEILAAGGAKLFRGVSAVERVGNAGRNILRSNGINLVDFGIIKNTRLSENVRFQLRADMFNAFNSRNFGIPNGDWNSGANFLNQWATNGGNRRTVFGIRVVF